MKIQPTILSILIVLFFSCTHQDFEKGEDQKIVINLSVTKDSLIAELAKMETDSLDCSADAYWQIISKGKAYIPILIESLTDTTLTNIYHGCKNEKLNIGELSYFALQEIGDFPAFVVTKIQFDVINMKDGWNCSSFYDYLFDNKNKKEYQHKVKTFYQKSQFEFYEYPDSVITDCMRNFSIKGKYEWIEQ